MKNGYFKNNGTNELMKGHHTVSSWRKSVISKIYERYEKKQKI
jgi:hypothetical protein